MIIVFDLDGTLIDSARDISESVSELVESYGAAPLPMSQVINMVGDGAPLLVRRALRESGVKPSAEEALERYMEIYNRRLMNNTSPYAGVVESLGVVLKRGPLAVLTNKPLGPSIGILEALRLRGFFTRVIGGDGEYGRKPDPAGLLALQSLAPGEQLVMIGDSPADWQAAQAAGVPFVFARFGFGAGKFGANPPAAAATIDHPREIDRALAAVHLKADTTK